MATHLHLHLHLDLHKLLLLLLCVNSSALVSICLYVCDCVCPISSNESPRLYVVPPTSPRHRSSYVILAVLAIQYSVKRYRVGAHGKGQLAGAREVVMALPALLVSNTSEFHASGKTQSLTRHLQAPSRRALSSGRKRLWLAADKVRPWRAIGVKAKRRRTQNGASPQLSPGAL